MVRVQISMPLIDVHYRCTHTRTDQHEFIPDSIQGLFYLFNVCSTPCNSIFRNCIAVIFVSSSVFVHD